VKLILFCTVVLFAQFSWAKLPKLIHSLDHDKPAFAKIVNNHDTSHLIISSFKLMGGDNVKKYLDVERLLNTRSINIESIVEEIVWPNEIEKYPQKINGNDFFVVASGFFPPTKNNGGISLVNLKTSKVKKISKEKKGWWYHRTRFWDYDGDGNLDIVTARAYKGMFWGKGAELIVLLAPNGTSRNEWEEQLLFEGPDVFFELVDFDNDGKFEVVASQFLFSKVTYHYHDEFTGRWVENTIDNAIGPGFDLSIVDLNGDGRDELMVTNHISTDKAGLFVYEIPADPKNEDWKKHVLYQGFKTTAVGIGQASPGNAKAFKPTVADKKYSIVVSGDGTEKVHLFTPTESPWKYRHDIIYSGRGIIGKVSTYDADRDGKAEIYIPAYDENKIHILEFEN